MSDELGARLVAAFEKAAKGMRSGMLAATANLSFLLDGLCAVPDSAVSPPADAAPVPKPGDSSPSRDSANPPAPLRGTPTCSECHDGLAGLVEHPPKQIARIFREFADLFDPPKK